VAKRTLTFDAVREIGRALPATEEATMYGSPALKVNGRMFACIAINKSAEPNSLAVLVGSDERDDLIAGDPSVYYVTSHYLDSPAVLVRLDRVRRDALRDLLLAAHRRASATPARRRRRPARSRR
jgi:hypothetical protein